MIIERAIELLDERILDPRAHGIHKFQGLGVLDLKRDHQTHRLIHAVSVNDWKNKRVQLYKLHRLRAGFPARRICLI